MNLLRKEFQRILNGLNFFYDHLDNFQGVCLSVQLLNDKWFLNKDWMHKLNYLLFEG